MKYNFLVIKNFHGHEKRFSALGCVKDSSIIHGEKFMVLNQGHEIDNCKIHDH